MESTIKNRYYKIIKDNETFAYIRVKKDFYLEGYLIEEKCLIVGYFTFYNDLNFYLLNNNTENSIDSLSVSSKNDLQHPNVNGIIHATDYCLYKTIMDEFCDVYSKEEICENFKITLIEDENIIKDINFLIRNYIRNLNSTSKLYYDMVSNHRYGNLKELISDLKNMRNALEKIGVSINNIEELNEYLQILKSKKEENNKQDKPNKDKIKHKKK